MYEEKATPISIVKEQIEEKFTCEFVKFNVRRRYTHRRVLQNHPVSFIDIKTVAMS